MHERKEKKEKTRLLTSDISVDQNAVARIRTSTFEKSSTGSLPSDNDNDGEQSFATLLLSIYVVVITFDRS